MTQKEHHIAALRHLLRSGEPGPHQDAPTPGPASVPGRALGPETDVGGPCLREVQKAVVGSAGRGPDLAAVRRDFLGSAGGTAQQLSSSTSLHGAPPSSPSAGMTSCKDSRARMKRGPPRKPRAGKTPPTPAAAAWQRLGALGPIATGFLQEETARGFADTTFVRRSWLQISGECPAVSTGHQCPQQGRGLCSPLAPAQPRLECCVSSGPYSVTGPDRAAGQAGSLGGDGTCTLSTRQCGAVVRAHPAMKPPRERGGRPG